MKHKEHVRAKRALDDAVKLINIAREHERKGVAESRGGKIGKLAKHAKKK